MDLYSISDKPEIIITHLFLKKTTKLFKSTEVRINALLLPTIQVYRNVQSQPIYYLPLPTNLSSIQKEIQPSMSHQLDTASLFTMENYFLQKFQPDAKQFFL